MAIELKGATGSGFGVQVTSENQLVTVSENQSLQHHNSRITKRTYQAFINTAITGTASILHFKNTSQTRITVFSYIRGQILDHSGGTAIPSANTYFKLMKNTSYTSGGTEVTPINMNFSSGNLAAASVYTGATVDQTPGVEFDRFYPVSEGDDFVYNKEGSIILGFNDTLELRIVTDHTAATVTGRFTFMEMSPTLTG